MKKFVIKKRGMVLKWLGTTALVNNNENVITNNKHSTSYTTKWIYNLNIKFDIKLDLKKLDIKTWFKILI